MNALVLANFPIAALIFAAIVGIPLWLTFKRPHRAGDPGAPAYSSTTAVPAQTAAVPARRAGGPSVSTARQHMAARIAVPGRRHATPPRTARSAARQDSVPAPHDHAAA